MLREARFCDFPHCQRLAESTCPLCERDGCYEAHLDGTYTLNLAAYIGEKSTMRTVTGYSLRVCAECYRSTFPVLVGDGREGTIPHLARDSISTIVVALRALLTKDALKEPA